MLYGRRQGLRPHMTAVGSGQGGGGRGVGGRGPGGGPQLSLHTPGGDRHESCSATILTRRF